MLLECNSPSASQGSFNFTFVPEVLGFIQGNGRVSTKGETQGLRGADPSLPQDPNSSEKPEILESDFKAVLLPALPPQPSQGRAGVSCAPGEGTAARQTTPSREHPSGKQPLTCHNCSHGLVMRPASCLGQTVQTGTAQTTSLQFASSSAPFPPPCPFFLFCFGFV